MSLEIFSRRRFLQFMAASAISTSLLPKVAHSIISQEHDTANDLLSFVDQKGMGPDLVSPEFTQEHFPLHKEKVLPPYMLTTEDINNTAVYLKNMLLDDGIIWKDTYKIVWTYQHYGVLDISSHGQKLLQHCKSTQEFLYNNISHLLDVNLKWEMLKKNRPNENDNSTRFNGYIGKYTYLVYRVSAIDDNGNLLAPHLINATPVERAINFIDSKNNKPSRSVLYIIRGTTSLLSPFSELIHLSTHEPSLRYANVLSKDNSPTEAKQLSNYAGETITEAAAILLAIEYMNKNGHNNRVPIIMSHIRSLKTRYSLISNAIEYMHRNGIQQALDIYLSEPGRLMQAINS